MNYYEDFTVEVRTLLCPSGRLAGHLLPGSRNARGPAPSTAPAAGSALRPPPRTPPAAPGTRPPKPWGDAGEGEGAGRARRRWQGLPSPPRRGWCSAPAPGWRARSRGGGSAAAGGRCRARGRRSPARPGGRGPGRSGSRAPAAPPWPPGGAAHARGAAHAHRPPRPPAAEAAAPPAGPRRRGPPARPVFPPRARGAWGEALAGGERRRGGRRRIPGPTGLESEVGKGLICPAGSHRCSYWAPSPPRTGGVRVLSVNIRWGGCLTLFCYKLFVVCYSSLAFLKRQNQTWLNFSLHSSHRDQYLSIFLVPRCLVSPPQSVQKRPFVPTGVRGSSGLLLEAAENEGRSLKLPYSSAWWRAGELVCLQPLLK